MTLTSLLLAACASAAGTTSGGPEGDGSGNPPVGVSEKAPGRNTGFGLTFGTRTNAQQPQGTIEATCHGLPRGVDQPHNESCNPYIGDTACGKSLPVLCVKKDGTAAPAGYTFGFYNGWIAGELASTPPVAGSALGSRANADALCAQSLGQGFVMAEFHDADGGWGFIGKIGALDTTMRSWVAIDDTKGNCWDATQ